jgi:hypothetical protein
MDDANFARSMEGLVSLLLSFKTKPYIRYQNTSEVSQVRAVRSAVLCCAECCAVLCCAVLCCAVLCCAVLCCAVLCCAVM